MLLRSSSTPILGSLLPSSSDTPSRDFESNNHDTKISFLHGGHSSFSSFSCNSSTPLGGFSDLDRKPSSKSLGSFRRAQSEGNLEGLMAAAAGGDFDDDLHTFKSRSSRKSHHSVLQTIPSFNMYSLSNGCEEEEEEGDEEDDDEGEEQGEDGFLKRSITIGDNITGEFSFVESLDFIKEEEGMVNINELQGFSIDDEEGRPKSPPLYLATGLGIGLGFGGGDNGGGSGGGEFSLPEYGEGARNNSDMEDYYKKMVEENPGNPLFLRNYANFLYQSKGDLRGAEEYYSRAILSDPGDGDMLSQYAKIVWELHHDHERASSYFERAVQVAPQDSHVHAAYASFLWETEFEEEEYSLQQDHNGISFYQTRAMTSASV